MLPEVTKTSLSLSFDEQVTVENSEQGYANQQILPHPKRHVQRTKSHDQENNHAILEENSPAGLVKGKEQLAKNSKELRSSSVPQNSPSRKPLKQILAPNQTQSRVMNKKQSHPLMPQRSHPVQSTAHPVPTRRGTSSVHSTQERPQKTFTENTTVRSKGNGKQTSAKGVSAIQRTECDQQQQVSNLAMVPKPQGSEGADNRTLHNFPRQEMESQKHQKEQNKGKQVDQQQFVRRTDNSNVQKPCLETVYEGGTPDGTLNQSMSETELELQIAEVSPAMHGSLVSCQSQKSTRSTHCGSHGRGNAGFILDQDERTIQGHVPAQRSSEVREGIYVHPTDSREQVYKHRIDSTTGSASNSNVQWQTREKERPASIANGDNCGIRMHQRILQEDAQVAGNITAMPSKKSSTSAEEPTLPDPYQLLMRQEAQLRELQEQVHTCRFLGRTASWKFKLIRSNYNLQWLISNTHCYIVTPNI